MKTPNTTLTPDFDRNTATLDALFSLPDNFGIVRRPLMPGGMRAVLYLTDGLCDMTVTERVIGFCLSHAGREDLIPSARAFADTLITYGETEVTSDMDTLYHAVATGCAALLCETYPGEAILIKCRKAPERALAEPEHDKVLRGAHIGFGEPLARNCALLRRQMPTRDLIMKAYSIGEETPTSLVVCYVQNRADEAYLSYLDTRLKTIKPDTLALGMQSLAECLVPRRAWNPFPRFRYTERPDAAAASLAEGTVLILCDGAPQAMLLPVSFFAFFQETNDFYLAPFTGTYLRLLRIAVFLVSIYLTPVWYLLVSHPHMIPQGLSHLRIEEPAAVPILIQLIIVELAIDGLKMASMNTPSALSNSLSVIGGLILGEFAVEVKWFLPDTILYMSVVAIASFTQHNYEMGYAVKYVRVATLLLCSLLGWWGLLAGSALFLFLVLTVPAPEERRRYFYPLIPFNGRVLLSLLIRLPKSRALRSS